MIYFYAGMALFFGTHLYSAVRSREPGKDLKQKLGYGPFMGLYSLISIAGFALIIYGYQNTPAGDILYSVPFDASYIHAIAMLIAFILLVSAYVPGNRIKPAARHPMLLAIIIWSASHLLMPTDFKELLLFGGFLAYGLIDAASAYRRPHRSPPASSVASDGIVLIAGIGGYVAMAYWLHPILFGTGPLAVF